MDNDELFASDGDDDSLNEDFGAAWAAAAAAARDDGADSVGSESSDSFDEEEMYRQHLEQELRDNLQRVKANDRSKTSIHIDGNDGEHVQNITYEDWEEIGRDINNNTHLRELYLDGALNSYHEQESHGHKMAALFRGLTMSSSIRKVSLGENDFDIGGIWSMVPFLKNATTLTNLSVSRNNIGSEGFYALFRTLSDSPIEEIYCSFCGIESIEIDDGHIPNNLRELWLNGNRINADGCRELTKLLQGRDSTLEKLYLGNNNIDNEGVVILVNALQRNTSLRRLQLNDNGSISHEGHVSLLKLVSDVSSIKATLQSNHTLCQLYMNIDGSFHDATNINMRHMNNPEAAGRAKVIRMQLNSVERTALCQLQGVNRSLYSEINPLHLPEVLSLVGQNHGQEELFVALKSSVAGLISTVNRKQCIQEEKECIRQKMAQLHARLHELDAELAAIEAVERNVVDIGRESGSNKRRRVFDENLG